MIPSPWYDSWERWDSDLGELCQSPIHDDNDRDKRPTPSTPCLQFRTQVLSDRSSSTPVENLGPTDQGPPNDKWDGRYERIVSVKVTRERRRTRPTVSESVKLSHGRPSPLCPLEPVQTRPPPRLEEEDPGTQGPYTTTLNVTLRYVVTPRPRRQNVFRWFWIS